MVYRDHWALAQWYRHYAALIGAEHLYIVAHGHDPEIARICPGASITTIPRDTLRGFDRTRNRMLNGFQAGLSEIYDWVIRTDADELICWNPSRYKGLPNVLRQRKSDAVFALGLNVFAFDDEVDCHDAPVLTKRRNAVFSGHYSKAWAVRNGQGMNRHGIVVSPDTAADVPFELPRGVYLLHLKFANHAALRLSNEHRMTVGRSKTKGTPGKAWRNAEEEAEDFFIAASQMPVMSWDQAQSVAYRTLGRSAVRDTKNGLERARSIRFKSRTVLPEWFGTLTP